MFVTATLLNLKRHLNRLRAVCYPPIETIRPNIRVKRKKDFKKGPVYVGDYQIENDDELKYNNGRNSCAPKDLCKFTKIKNKEDLLNSDIDYILVNNKKWFFYTYDKIGHFFLEDGSRKVEIEFPVWMEMHNVFETVGVRGAVSDVLSKCSGKRLPDTQKLVNCFSDDLCRAVFNNNPPQEAMEFAILELYELLKKETADYMETIEAKNIMASEEMAEFLQTHSFGKDTAYKHIVHQFLSGRSEFMFKCAKDINLINNPDLLPFYSNIRDHLRHPDIEIEKLNPQKVYEDFCAILNERPNYNCKAYKQVQLGINTVLALQLETFSFLAGILDEWVDPQYKTGKDGKIEYPKGYLDNLVQKGLLTEAQKRTFDNLRHRTSAIAHRDPHIRKGQNIQNLTPDKILQKIRLKLLQRHKRIDATVVKVCDKIRKRQKQ